MQATGGSGELRRHLNDAGRSHDLELLRCIEGDALPGFWWKQARRDSVQVSILEDSNQPLANHGDLTPVRRHT